MDRKKVSIQEEYMLGHGFRESARLHVQHWMWQYQLGYLLHPIIPKGPEMCIIDIGTGNACWLVELAHQMGSKWQLQGVDIAKLQFPADEYLPKNVSLKVMDVFGHIPEEMVEKFDVVHIRTFALVIKNSDPMPLLQNLIRMIKPGGYLQWDELDCATCSTHVPNEGTGKQNCEELLRIFERLMNKTGVDFGWISDLSSTFKSSNLDVLASSRLTPINDLRKAVTDDFLMGLEQNFPNAPPALLGSQEDYRELLKNAVRETERGVSFGVDMVVVVGRKPTK